LKSPKNTSWFKLLLRWFTKKRPVTTLRNPRFNPIVIEDIAQELDLAQLAQAQGASNLPHPEHIGSFGLESAIVAKVIKKRSEHIQYFIEKEKILDAEIERRGFTTNVERALAAPQEFADKAANLFDQHKPELVEAVQKAQAAKDELEQFQKENKLRRKAYCPTGFNKFRSWTILVFLMVFESVANAGFFAMGLDGGLLAGLAMAMLCAFFNLAVPFCGGCFVGKLNHVNPGQKSLGALVLVATLAAMITVALGIGHIRDALNAGSEQYAELALDAFLASPLELQDLFSYLLSVLSFFFASFALGDSYKMSDPYPGYTKITQQFEEADANLRQVQEELGDMLMDLKDELTAQIDKALDEAGENIAKLTETLTAVREARQSCRVEMSNAQHSADALIVQYRALLAQYRTDGKQVSQRDLPSLPEPNAPAFDPASAQAALERVRQAHARLSNEIQRLKADITRGYDGANEQFNTLDDAVRKTLERGNLSYA
jgi:hypothetical protein